MRGAIKGTRFFPNRLHVTEHPLYMTWLTMRQRCFNPKNTRFKYYGARGITVCERWLKFDGFQADMGASFRSDLELERKDNNGNYDPSNCIWISRKKQQQNKRSSHKVTICGKTKSLSEWEEQTGIKANTILTRIRRWWPEDRLLKIANP